MYTAYRIGLLACFLVWAEALHLSEFHFSCLQVKDMKENLLSLGPLDLQMNKTIFQKQ